jgi:biotin carboxyl carrier protein
MLTETGPKEAVLWWEPTAETAEKNSPRAELWWQGQRYKLDSSILGLKVTTSTRQDIATGQAHAHAEDETSLCAPMPGLVVKVLVEAQAPVAKGDPVVVMESMKMEMTLTAPASGQAVSRVQAGQRVAMGAVLMEICPAKDPVDETPSSSSPAGT